VHIGPANLPILYQFGGAIERRIIELARAQSKLGHEVVVYSSGDEKVESRVDGVAVRHIPLRINGKGRFLEFQVRAVRDLRSRSGPRPDILHFHSQPEGAFLARRLNARKFLSYDNFDFRNSSSNHLAMVYRRLLMRFDKLLPCSQYCLLKSQSLWDFPSQLVTPLFNGVNIEQFSPDQAQGLRESERLQLDGKIALYVGRVCRQKGTHVLIEAFRIINAARSDIKLVIAGPISQFGSTEDASMWKEQIDEVRGLYLGAVEEERLSSIYNLADIFVMPTIELEMFGMAVIEAQACGKPVVASDHGGLKETVPESCGGRFPIGDGRALAQQIMSLIDNETIYARCSQNAIKNASQYAWSRIAETAIDIYEAR